MLSYQCFKTSGKDSLIVHQEKIQRFFLENNVSEPQILFVTEFCYGIFSKTLITTIIYEKDNDEKPSITFRIPKKGE